MQPAKRLHDVRSRLRRGRREALEVASTWPDRAHSASQRFLAIVSDIVVHRFPLFSMVVAAILLVAVCVVVWTITLAFVSPGDAEERTNLLATLAQIVGGFALLAGLYMTFRTYRVNREGQITERFSRAIDHLGKEELAIRLGGIYALERIARDSSRDHPQIVELLTAFVRETSPVSEERHKTWADWEMSGGSEAELREALGEDDSRVKPEIQAILTVLGRRARGAGRQEPIELDLVRTDLRRVSWSGAYIQGAILISCDLQGTWLKGANLTGASLNGSNLYGATFAGASLRSAWVQHVVAVGSPFTEVDFTGANLYGSKFQSAWFVRANLTGVAFNRCNLDHAQFLNARLHRVRFRKTSLNDTDFSEADLTNADLRGLDLRTCRGLTAEQVAKAFTDAKTQLPANLPAQLAN